jgi:hypothetical protein
LLIKTKFKSKMERTDSEGMDTTQSAEKGKSLSRKC